MCILHFALCIAFFKITKKTEKEKRKRKEPKEKEINKKNKEKIEILYSIILNITRI